MQDFIILIFSLFAQPQPKEQGQKTEVVQQEPKSNKQEEQVVMPTSYPQSPFCDISKEMPQESTDPLVGFNEDVYCD